MPKKTKYKRGEKIPETPCIKKYRNVLVDKMHNARYYIYSNRKLDKKDMIREVRAYCISIEKFYPDYGARINIICRD